MPKKKVLDFKPAPRPEQVGDKRPKQMEDRKHRPGECADSASPRESVRMRFLEQHSYDSGATLKPGARTRASNHTKV
jgi:hypothetical protein